MFRRRRIVRKAAERAARFPPISSSAAGARGTGRGCARLQPNTLIRVERCAGPAAWSYNGASLFRAWLVLAAVGVSAARGAAPSYSSDGIVNASDYAPGPFAPGSIVSIFGIDLSFGTLGLTADNTTARTLPNELSNVRVYLNNSLAPLLFVCPTQINFIVPSNLRPGTIPLRVVRQGISGPEVGMTLVDAAPQLFKSKDGYVLAQHGGDYSIVTSDAPARGGEVIVMYATGLGRTQPYPAPSEIPNYPGKVVSELKLTIAGLAVGPERIWYAGLSPGMAGVYQINVQVPDNLDANPEIRVSMAGQSSAAGIKLRTQPDSGEPR
ncbi:MAG: hypothetical protein C5B51_23125 [Terriglobia bacterium]|nr:MAG: hypothetical protein C5B51_23125 [Terriglobia bacterium]